MSGGIVGLKRSRCKNPECPIYDQWRYGTERDWGRHQDAHDRDTHTSQTSPTGRQYGQETTT